MRRVSSRFIRRVAVITVVSLLLVPVTVVADDGSIAAPAAKIGPPPGNSGFARIQPPIGLAFLDWMQIIWFAARIAVPIG